MRLDAHGQVAKRIKVLLVDDHPVVRQGVKASLHIDPRIRIVGEAGSGLEAIRKAKKLSPDVILMDIHMPKMSGVEATRILHKKVPKSKVLMLTMYDNQAYVMDSIRAGAKGYVLKNSPAEELPRAIDAVHNNEAYFSSSVSQAVLNEYVRDPRASSRPRATTEISQREKEVLALIAEGLSNKAIAERLYLSVRTVETHREHLMKKLNLHNTAWLTRYAVTHKIV